MIESIDILFGSTGQKIYLDAAEGRPSSVTSVSVWDSLEADTAPVRAAVGAPSVEAVTTTFDAASGVGQDDVTKCALTATVGFARGRVYLATNVTGQREFVDAERIGAGDAIYGRTPLAHTYAAADTFVSTRLEATIDTTWAAAVANLSDPERTSPRWRAVWLYTVDSVVYRTTTYFDLTRSPYVHSVTPASMDRGARGWLDRLPIDERRGQGETLIKEAAWQVRQDLFKRKRTDKAQRNNATINELVRRKAIFLVSEMAFRLGATTAQVVEYDSGRYESYLAQSIEETEQQTDASGAGGTGPRAPYWRK